MIAVPSPRDLRHMNAAEGYLMLGMAEHALDELAGVTRPLVDPFPYFLLKGYALRDLQRYAAALEAFEGAFNANPDHLGLLLAMGWCYKRTAQLPRAITMLELAQRVDPEDALVTYNLSCYWALAGEKTKCLTSLAKALQLDEEFRSSIETETDFDPVRNDPDFRRMLRIFDNEKLLAQKKG
jgi:tetratricopeptide (TPR) repeat protein